MTETEKAKDSCAKQKKKTKGDDEEGRRMRNREMPEKTNKEMTGKKSEKVGKRAQGGEEKPYEK